MLPQQPLAQFSVNVSLEIGLFLLNSLNNSIIAF